MIQEKGTGGIGIYHQTVGGVSVWASYILILSNTVHIVGNINL